MPPTKLHPKGEFLVDSRFLSCDHGIHPLGEAYVHKDGTLDIRFRTNKLERAYRNSKDGVRLLGTERHRRFVQRIDLIGEAQSIEELSRLPVLHWHPLKGERAGQYAITLVGNWRLILTLVENAPNTVRLEEVIDYHGD